MLTVLSTVRAWAVASQNRACRNATMALGALVERREEREQVEQFLADHAEHAAPLPAEQSGTLARRTVQVPQPRNRADTSLTSDVNT